MYVFRRRYSPNSEAGRRSTSAFLIPPAVSLLISCVQKVIAYAAAYAIMIKKIRKETGNMTIDYEVTEK